MRGAAVRTQFSDAVLSLGLALLTLVWVNLPMAADGPVTEGTLLPPFSQPGETGDVEVCYSGCSQVIVAAVNADWEQGVVDLVNAERAEQGLPPLKRVAALDNASRYHAADMIQDDYFEHNSYDRSGSNLVQACSWSTRVAKFYSGWSSLAENIAGGYGSPEAVMSAWLGSSGHRANVLSTGNWEIGVGYYGGGEWGHYWVQDFGRRSDVYPLIINQDAASTNSRNVSLYIYGTWDQIRLRNGDGDWTAWQSFQNTMSWTLGVSNGLRTVEAEMRQGSTRTALSSDTINFSGPTLDNLPDAITFCYSIPEQRLLFSSYQMTPRNGGNGESLAWSLSTAGHWFVAAPASGTTPNSFTITPGGFDTYTTATLRGVATVTVTSPPGVEGSPHVIDLTLRIVNQTFHRIYLPLSLKNGP